MAHNGINFVPKKIDSRVLVRNLRRAIRNYERRYEIPSCEMLKLLQTAQTRETAEILKWMQCYHGLQFIKQVTYRKIGE